MPQTRDLARGKPVSRQQRRENQVHHIDSRRPETPWRGNHGNLLGVSEQQKVARLNRCEEVLNTATHPLHRPPNDVGGAAGAVVEATSTMVGCVRSKCSKARATVSSSSTQERA